MPAEPAAPVSAWQRLRHVFLTGLFILLPLVITIWLLGLLLRMVETVASPILLGILCPAGGTSATGTANSCTLPFVGRAA